MIETEIIIIVYRKTDIDTITQKICERKIQVPVFILEYENIYQLKLSSDYEEWELDSAITECFPDYEFTTDLASGRKEIRVQISRYQSEFSTDGWGRQIENSLNQVKYLIKKQTKTPEKFNPGIKVLFGESIHDYCINIVEGINTLTGEKGFLILDYFKKKAGGGVNAEVLKDRLYESPIEAFYSGFPKLQDVVNNDFKDNLKQQKKKLTGEQKVPRKIVRGFIKSCNDSDFDGMIINLANNIVYERRINGRTELKIEGLEEFVKHIKSSSQDLCSKNFTIRSQWDFRLDNITIGVKFFSKLPDSTTGNLLKCQRFCFILRNDRIQTIIEDN